MKKKFGILFLLLAFVAGAIASKKVKAVGDLVDKIPGGK